MSEEQDIQDLENTIQEASEKLNIDIDILRAITPEEVQYLLDHCPFLQIVGPEKKIKKPDVKLIQSDSGWDIHDYGDAMSSSPGRFIFGGGDFRISLEGEDDNGGDVINPGKGTVVNQAWVTAGDMINLAQQKGWKFLTIVDGHAIMKRAAWIKASELGITVDGFEPSLEDERVRKLVLESGEAFKLRKESIRPKK
ncbi:MAG: hypothetical protein KDH94_00330 [Coxiellaceae bacterium]|nr:hypothetical protein [Coxiellaceae bacterium]